MMQRIAKLLFIISLTTQLASCVIPDNSTTQYARDGIYRDSVTTPGKVAYFSFQIPQYKDHYEYQKMDTIHYQDDSAAYVSFGPSSKDLTIYNVAVGLKQSREPYDSDDNFATRWQQQLFKKRFSEPAKKLLERRTKINGHPAIYRVYQQEVQEQQSLYYSHERQTITYMSYVVDCGQYIAFFQAQGSSVSLINPVTEQIDNVVRRGNWPPMVSLVHSFNLNVRKNVPLT